MLLAVATLGVLLGLSRIPSKAAAR
jgi:hypothetical protein